VAFHKKRSKALNFEKFCQRAASNTKALAKEAKKVEEAKKAEVAGTAAVVKAATQAPKQARTRNDDENGATGAKKALAPAKPRAAVAEKGAAAEVTGKKGQVSCVFFGVGAGGGGPDAAVI
jgi:hypothetical protein